MDIPVDWSQILQWSGILTIVFLSLAIVSFIFRWGIRFRLVGITGFMAVVTVGIFGLGLGLFTRSVVPGAVRFALVYDNGANQAVITVTPEVNAAEVEATLRQAANDLLSYGRIGVGGDNELTIRARTLIHPEPGVTKPLYLGEVRRSLQDERTSTPLRNDQIELQIFSEKFAELPGKNDV
ncbi:MAG: Ycf51 family protein [Gomphosphaeria aponina SAG 52.96 = DSM 107014]|uniref:Ycf51 family protein n=1 Tax=Gomphosphaeria aponina SAG 52.96 = DSM 107014 TaxID=1521640 RepID=A0A941JVJ6_9CHRO|nr:Ycf51 family protein [Gomphosphaeria aponina SAG 52.96 = DSM 107014]